MATPTSPATLPTGCSSFNFPGFNFTVGYDFGGCVAGQPSVLLSCCAKVGSTPVFANNTCGCPYNASFIPPVDDIFGSCAIDNNGSATCGSTTVWRAPTTSAAVMKSFFRWNTAVVVLGAALLLGAVGV
ncbi:hypothetical protein C8R44DRAFT_370234 [Mycena epipterygia]|nr:hypothetical protein C8R44DRAFT_370234 [Mycena epipterygia]